MVSESEFDKNQKEFMAQQMQAQTTVQPPAEASPSGTIGTTLPKEITQTISSAGNAISDFFNVPQNQRTGDGLPDIPAILSGSSSDEVAPQDRLWIGGGVEVAAETRAVYNSLINNGLTKKAAASGAAQVAQMLKNGVASDVAVDKAAFWAALRNLPKTPEGKTFASKISADALASFKSPVAPTAAGLSNVIQQLGDFVKKNPLKSIGGTFIFGSIFRSIIGDYTKGLLGQDEASGRIATEFYANGLISKEQLHSELDGRGYSDPVIAAYESTGEDMKIQTDFFNDLGPHIGVTPIIGQSRIEYAHRVISEYKKQQEAQIAAQQPVGAQGQTQAEVNKIQRRFAIAAQSNYATTASGQIIPPENLPSSSQPDALTKLKESDLAGAAGAYTPAPTTNAGGGVFTPAYRTKDELQNKLGASITEEAWQRYLRTGRI